MPFPDLIFVTPRGAYAAGSVGPPTSSLWTSTPSKPRPDTSAEETDEAARFPAASPARLSS